jgi:hypothetical protein
VEIAWRWFFLSFCVVVMLGVAMVVGDAVRVGARESSALTSRNLPMVLMATFSLFRRYQLVLEGSLWIVLAAVAVFWILGGSLVHAWLTGRRLLPLAVLRSLALVAGTAAVFSGVVMIVAVSAQKQAPGTSLGLVSLFSLVVYGCWRWTSLLIGVLTYAPDVRRGWASFVAHGPALALAAATNSTLKWVAMFAVSVSAAAAAMAIPRNAGWLVPGVFIFWLLAMLSVSGFFAARLKDQLATSTTPIEGHSMSLETRNSQLVR